MSTMTRRWPQVPAITLSNQVYAAIRDRLLDAEVTPGQFIREQEVSDAMGVSRTPVREALSRLASEGFLERIPHRGFRVPSEPLSSLLELYPILSALEVAAGKLALARLGPPDFAELRRINAELRVAMERNDSPRSLELNNQFHHYLTERSGNQRLTALLDDLRQQVTRLEVWYFSNRDYGEQAVREHEQIVRAAEGGDLETALRILEKNMMLTYTLLLEEAGRGDGLPAGLA